MIELLDQPDTTALFLDLVNDARDLCSDFVENSGRADPGQMFSIRDSYANLNLAPVLKVRSHFDSSIHDFIFQAVPRNRLQINTVSESDHGDFTANDSASNKRDQFVFTVVSEVIEGVEEIIPSLVRVETPKQRLDFLWTIFASTPHAVIEVDGRPPKREGGVVGIHSSCTPTESSERGVI